MYPFAGQAPFRDQLEEVEIFIPSSTINAATGEDEFVHPENPLKVHASVMKLEGTEPFEADDRSPFNRYQVRVWLALPAITSKTEVVIRGKKYNVDGDPVISKQPSMKRREMTRFTVTRKGR